jgi:endonuclease-8
MPEGDTVYLVARTLHRALAGQVLVRSDLRVRALATVDLSGQTVVGVVARGKHLLLRTGAGWTLHTHLGMDGRWRIHPASHRTLGVPAFQVRVLLWTERNRAVGSNLPLVELLQTSQEEGRLAHLGPDLLASDFQVDEALRRLRAHPQRQVADALLDQRNLAGIGNLFKSEVLFMTGEDPWTPVQQVRDLPGMVDLARRLLQASCRQEGLQSTTGRRSPVEKNWVFRRQGQPCRRCGELIRVARQGALAGQERLTWWCPRCQAGPCCPTGRLHLRL